MVFDGWSWSSRRYATGAAARSELTAGGAGADAPGVGSYDVDGAWRAMDAGGSKVVRGASMASSRPEEACMGDDTPVMYGEGMGPTPGIGGGRRVIEWKRTLWC